MIISLRARPETINHEWPPAGKSLLAVDFKSQSIERRCPACDAAAGAATGHKNGFELLSCQTCRTLYTALAPEAGSAQDYDGYYGAENLSVPDFIQQRLGEIIGGFSAYRRTNRFLDIGFGAGTLMQAAAREGWDVEGIEVSRTAVEHARRLGFKVFCGELAEAEYPADYFDVVTASEVLEHLLHPQPLLSEIARILRPGGLFWATTPHGRGISNRALGLKWSVICPPEHLHLFSLGGMKRMLRAAGFRRVRVVAEGVNPYEIMQTLRRPQSSGNGASVEGSGLERVEASYELNENLSKSPVRRALKNTANGLLRLSRLGDSIKIFAEK